MAAYYNEIDKYAAQWLRNLIAAGYIAPGDVDERSIEDVKPSDLIGYTQCHFFAGIGVWSYALRSAGWADSRPVWTGSCPCQPFSAAGKRGGTADERHLWPAWEWLIRYAKPRGVPVLGEQVASKDGLAWFDLVHADLEGQGYTVRALDLCAAGVGAPHIRQRLWFVGDTADESRQRDAGEVLAEETRLDGARLGVDGRVSIGFEHASAGVARQLAGAERNPRGARRAAVESAEGARAAAAGTSTESRRRSVSYLVGDADDAGSQGRGVSGADRERVGADQRAAGTAGTADGMEQSSSVGRQRGQAPAQGHEHDRAASERPQGEHGFGIPSAYRRATAGFWHDAEWLACIDGKARPVEPGTFPLAHGAPARVGRLRAYGNAIVAPLAEEFIRAYLG